MGDRIHPFLTLTVVLHHSPMLPFILTALVALSSSCSMLRTRFALILVAHKLPAIHCQRLFSEIIEDMVDILLMLEVHFTEDSEVDDLFCGAPSGIDTTTLVVL